MMPSCDCKAAPGVMVDCSTELYTDCSYCFIIIFIIIITINVVVVSVWEGGGERRGVMLLPGGL